MTRELVLDLSHDSASGYDVYALDVAGDGCTLVVDFGHDYRRQASFVGFDAEGTATFFERLADEFEVELPSPLGLCDAPGPLEVTLVGESEDTDGSVWVTMRWHLAPAIELEARLNAAKQTGIVTPRLGTPRSALLAWRQLVLNEAVPPSAPDLSADPPWLVDHRPWVHGLVGLTEAFSRASATQRGFVGVGEDPGLLFVNEGGADLDILFETDRIDGFAVAGDDVFVVHEDGGEGVVSRIVPVNTDEVDVEDLYRAPRHLPADAIVVSPGGSLVAFAIPGRADARFDTLVVNVQGDEVACLEDCWPVDWSPAGLQLRGIDAEAARIWTDDGLLANVAPMRQVGAYTLHIGQGQVRFDDRVFEVPNAPHARLEGRSYQAIDGGLLVANWDRPYILDPRTGEGWALTPQGLSARHVVVSQDGECVLLMLQGASMFAKIGPGQDDAHDASDAFASDRFAVGEFETDISLAELSRLHGLSAYEIRHRLTHAAHAFKDVRVTRAIEAWENDIHAVAGLGVDGAGAWVALADRLDAATWHRGFTRAVEQTFARRLSDEAFLEFAIHGGVTPGDEVNRVQEALVGARMAWLDPPQSDMQERVALAVEVSLEVLADLRHTALPTNLWDATVARAGRLHELLALGVPDVVGLGETIDLLRSIEELATR